MSFLLKITILLGVAVGLLVTVALGIGSALHWLVPAVDFGMAVLIGLLAFGFAIGFLLFTFAEAQTQIVRELGDAAAARLDAEEPAAFRNSRRASPPRSRRDLAS